MLVWIIVAFLIYCAIYSVYRNAKDKKVYNNGTCPKCGKGTYRIYYHKASCDEIPVCNFGPSNWGKNPNETQFQCDKCGKIITILFVTKLPGYSETFIQDKINERHKLMSKQFVEYRGVSDDYWA